PVHSADGLNAGDFFVEQHNLLDLHIAADSAEEQFLADIGCLFTQNDPPLGRKMVIGGGVSGCQLAPGQVAGVNGGGGVGFEIFDGGRCGEGEIRGFQDGAVRENDLKKFAGEGEFISVDPVVHAGGEKFSVIQAAAPGNGVVLQFKIGGMGD